MTYQGLLLLVGLGARIALPDAPRPPRQRPAMDPHVPSRGLSPSLLLSHPLAFDRRAQL